MPTPGRAAPDRCTICEARAAGYTNGGPTPSSLLLWSDAAAVGEEGDGLPCNIHMASRLTRINLVQGEVEGIVYPVSSC